ncbi:2OG-Fe(II) oxygenase superfamily, putative [Angomonas deanei]|uniref:2OG-Fe(II) oxygenase superfamily, putative n=1 Tax=Angomonas deanei TaxID=59799 RepID=A0A7G2C1I9_9TRYP|nr:2OG-Fe(II) oxygenase superfamily, putative [Angomonas deanei]
MMRRLIPVRNGSAVRKALATVVTANALRFTSNSSSLSSQLKTKGFVNSTPNCSFDFADSNALSGVDLATDITTELATEVDFVSHIYGPWLVMTDDLQGELFVDKDKFVFYRPANGLGYGIGVMEVIDAGENGTAFTLKLEVYGYEQTETVAPVFALRFDVTGMIKKVSSKSTDYRTHSLVGIWRKTDRNPLLTAEKKEVTTTGQFNAAKLEPWNPSALPPNWEPNRELQEVFKAVFPEELHLSSHTRRALENKGKNEGKKYNHLQLADYAVGNIPGVYYIPNYVSEQEEAEISQRIKNTPQELKSTLKKRTVQEWGCTMCDECQKSFVTDANMPAWVQQCTDMLVYDGIFTPTTFPNSVRIHEYEPGEGIGPHVDGPIYVPLVTVLSLSSTCVMNFYPRREPYPDKPMEHYNDTFKFSEGDIGRETPIQSVVMEPGSLLIFEGEAYYYYPHGVSDKEVSDLAPEFSGEVVNRHLLKDANIQKVERKYRASITTRNLLTRCQHQPTRAEYAMKRAWYVYNQRTVPSELFPSNEASASEPSLAPASSPGTPVVDPQSSPRLVQLEAKVDHVLKQQEKIVRGIEEIKDIIAASINASSGYQKETSTILNHLSQTVLELDAKVEDITDALEEKK